MSSSSSRSIPGCFAPIYQFLQHLTATDISNAFGWQLISFFFPSDMHCFRKYLKRTESFVGQLMGRKNRKIKVQQEGCSPKKRTFSFKNADTHNPSFLTTCCFLWRLNSKGFFWTLCAHNHTNQFVLLNKSVIFEKRNVSFSGRSIIVHKFLQKSCTLELFWPQPS